MGSPRRFWFRSLVHRMGRYAQLALSSLAGLAGFGGAAYALGGQAVKPPFDPNEAMAAYELFPAVATAVQAVASDLAGVPLQARTITQVAGDKARTQVEDPAIDLLRKPNPFTGGFLFRKQLATDWLLNGDAFAEKTDSALWRHHPYDVEVVPGVVGISHYLVRDANGNQRRVMPRDMLHIRDVSVRRGSASWYGHSPIRTLYDDLLTDYRTRELARSQAERGRPDVLISVKEGLSPEQAEEIAAQYEEGRQKKRSAYVFGDSIEVNTVNYTARDLEFIKRAELTVEAVLMLYEVPPARAGLVSANYGASRQQMRTYVESLIRRSKLWNDVWSSLCRPGIEIVHDFSEFEALQVAKSDQLKRVILWTTIGATPAEAAAYEGLHDAPVPDERVDAPAPTSDSRRPDEPQDTRRSVEVDAVVAAVPDPHVLGSMLAAALAESAARWELLADDLEAGVSLRLLRRWEAENLFRCLDEAGLPPAVARHVAEAHAELAVAVVDVLVSTGQPVENLTQREHWSADRARRMAADLVRGLKEAA